MVLVTGVNGQLGFDVVEELNKRNIIFTGVSHEELDLTIKEDVLKYCIKLRPSEIIHCAGYTDVLKAEVDLEEKARCYEVNCKSVEYLAEIAMAMNSKVVYISTDFVFDGTKVGEYEVDDNTAPLSNYGESKNDGEKVLRKLTDRHFIIRTSWLFGENGNNFIDKISAIAKKNDEIDVVSDQVGSPTYTKNLAERICDLVVTDKFGTYHITNEGYCSRAEFAEKIIKEMKLNCKVNYVSSKDYGSTVKRPLNSKLSKKELLLNGFLKLESWESAVQNYIFSNEQ